MEPKTSKQQKTKALNIADVSSSAIRTIRMQQGLTQFEYTLPDDDVASNYFDLTISSPLGNDACNLPIAAGNILNGNYIYVGGSMAGNFTVEIKDESGNVLQTFNTSGEYTVSVLSGIQQVIGNTSTTITQDIIN